MRILHIQFVVLVAFFGPLTAHSAELEEIVVTAQKREQALNDVSISITAFTGARLDELGITQPIDIAAHTPGLYIKPTVGDQNPVITIRGVGFNDFTPIQNPGAGVYVDQVIVPYHPMMSFQLLDLERVEVLKGPQGTLYGRNTTAGAINFVSVKPTQEFSGTVRLDYSSWDTIDAEAAIGGGLSETISARVALSQYKRSSSFQTNRANPSDDIGEKDRVSYRLSLAMELSNFDALLNIHGGKDESGQVALEHLASFDAVTFVEPCASVAAGVRAEGECVNAGLYADIDSDPYAGDYSVTNGGSDNTAIGVGLTMNWELENDWVVTSVTGFDSYERNQLQDIDASPFIFLDNSFIDDTESFSQEIRITAVAESLNWIVGVYYGDDSVEALQAVDSSQGIGPAAITNDQGSQSFAVFANLDKSLTDTMTLIAGLRYTDDQKDWSGGSDAAGLGVNNFGSGAISETDVSGQIGIEYRPNDSSLLFAKFAKGYRSGGFPGGFSVAPQQLLPFDKEEVLSYELGSKTTLADNSLQLNVALYYYDWKDLQTQFTENRNGFISLFLTNAGDADILGFDLDFNWSVSDSFSLLGGINYMDSEVTSTDPRLDGKTLANAPDLTYNIAAEYTAEVGDFELKFRVDNSFTDDRFFTSDNVPVFRGDSYSLTNFRIALTPSEGDWGVAVWGRNVGSEEYRTEGFNQFGLFGSSYHAYGEPDSYGISLDVGF